MVYTNKNTQLTDYTSLVYNGIVQQKNTKLYFYKNTRLLVPSPWYIGSRLFSNLRLEPYRVCLVQVQIQAWLAF
jgi:hypothetical protein